MFLNSSKVLKERIMSAQVVRYPSPKETTVCSQLVMFFGERGFKKKLHLEDIPSRPIREIFRIWACCFRDVPFVGRDERITVARFLFAADLSVVQWQHERIRPEIRLNTRSEIERINRILWCWMIIVARRLFCNRYKGFLAEMMEKLASPEFCIHLPTWNPEWMDEIRSKWSA